MSRPYIRYPGGKSKQTDRILRYFYDHEEDYRESFIGGGSVFLRLDFHTAWINDIDPEIYDLWRLVKHNPNVLISLINQHTKIITHDKTPDRIKQALDLWDLIKDNNTYPPGYRALFLNKTCFSGVKSGGPTGGRHQTGDYTLASRWAPEMTIKRILAAHEKLKNVRITNLSYEDTMLESSDDTCFYFDPPYLEKGSQCYDFPFTIEDHERFANVVSNCEHRYVVTLDDCENLRNIWSTLVPKHLILSETWLYSMTDHRDSNRVGREMFIVDQRSYDIYSSRKPRQKRKREY